MKSTILVSGVYAEDLFGWFANHVFESGGDGCGLLVCKNYKEVATWFEEWFELEFKRPTHPRDEYGDIVNYHDSNENFMFSDMTHSMFPGDYTFIVLENCPFNGYDAAESRIIEPTY